MDKNLNVRDSFKTDFQLEKSSPKEKLKKKIFLKKDLFEFDLIKDNLKFRLLSHALKSIFIRKKVILITKKSFLNDKILQFFTFLTQEAFNIDISFLSIGKYNNEKEKYQEYIVLDQFDILNNPNNSIKPQELSVETQIVKDFLFDPNLIESLNKLKKEIQKIYNSSKNIADFISNCADKDNLSPKTILQHLNRAHNIEVGNIYLNFLLEIVQKYFKVELPFKE